MALQLRGNRQVTLRVGRDIGDIPEMVRTDVRANPDVGGFIAVSMENVRLALEQLAVDIRRDHGQIGTIIAVGRGGMTPARFLADSLDVKTLPLITAQRYRGDNSMSRQTASSMTEIGPLPEGLKGAKTPVLIADDVSDDGITLRQINNAVRDYIGNGKTPVVITATFASKEGTLFVPDYYAATTPKSTWIIFEHEVMESARTFIGQNDMEALAFLRRSFRTYGPDVELPRMVDSSSPSHDKER